MRRIALVAAAFACAPGAATAADARDVAVELWAPASNGYTFEFGIEDHPGRGPAGFMFSKETKGIDSDEPGYSLEAAGYSARRGGSLRGRRLTAEVGAFGAVDARFEQRGVNRRVHRYGGRCKEVYVTRRGSFVGRIDFAGEGGYAEVHRKSVRGRVDSHRLSGCHGRRSGRRGPSALKPSAAAAPAKDTVLLASCGADPGTGFLAGRHSGVAGVVASSDERANGMRVVRFLVATGDRSWFRAGSKLRRATVAPAFPAFTGTASYARSALIGDLRVSLPGLADVPLTPGDAVLGLEDDVSIPDCYPFGD